MTDEEKIDVLIDAMTKLHEIEAQVKDVREALEDLSSEMHQDSTET
ncbi:hypothetical protein [Lentilitoribacter sp. EG35]